MSRVYRLRVVLTDHRWRVPRGAPNILRTIEIRDNQTLHTLHKAIFEAYDRDDETHLYAFYLDKGRRGNWYMPPEGWDPLWDDDTVRNAARTALKQLALATGQTFYYLFDFGAEWHHRIKVLSIEERQDPGAYPRVTDRQGASPAEYQDDGEEEMPADAVRGSRMATKALERRDFESEEALKAFLDTELSVANPQAVTDPLDRAQELVYQAGQVEGKERSRLARQALAITPDCADAYLILAEDVDSLPEVVRLHHQALEAAERVLGPAVFAEDAGHFWELIETHPYMRARSSLAHTLWIAGQADEAIGHMKDLLRLNPGDNQGLRYILVHWYLARGSTQKASDLLERYPEDGTALWLFPKALCTFQLKGDTPAARSALEAALQANPHVFNILAEWGMKGDLEDPPSSFTLGEPDEALAYVHEGLEAWVETEGALEWLIVVGTVW